MMNPSDSHPRCALSRARRLPPPYVVQLAGEYVMGIVDDVARWSETREASALATFARANPAYLATLARRATSYWNCYRRRAYPDRTDYPGTRVSARMRPDATLR